MAPSLKLFICTNLNCAETQAPQRGHPFGFASVEQQPACPKCGISMADPRFGRVIRRIVAIHFDPPAPVPGFGMNYRACDHEAAIQVKGGPQGMDDDFMPNPYHQGTGDVDAVTCPACRATKEWQEAMAAKHSESTAAHKGAMARLRQFVVMA